MNLPTSKFHVIYITVIIALVILVGYLIYINIKNTDEVVYTQTISPMVEGLVNSQYIKIGNEVFWAINSSAESNNFVVYKGDLKPSRYDHDGSSRIYTYGSDGKFLYYMGDMIIESGSYLDPEENLGDFRPIENGNKLHHYGKTKKYVYYKNLLIEGADPFTFTPLWNRADEGCSPPPYSKDSKNVFFENRIVYGADPETFTFDALNNEYGKDKNNVYLKDKIVEGLNPNNFSIPSNCEYGYGSSKLAILNN